MICEEFLGGKMDENPIRKRLLENRDQIERALSVAISGNPYAAEPDRERRISRLQAKAHLSRQEACAIDELIDRVEEDARTERGEAVGAPVPSSEGAERVWGDTVDFVNVSFLEKGARIARAVGRVAFRNGRPQGSGFLIGQNLFLTNHHVVPSPEFADRLMVQFDYETDLAGSHKQPTTFAIDTSIFINSDDSRDGLDYALFLVGPRLTGEKPLEYFGWSGLSDAKDKHMIGEFANIVQHPNGRFKEVVLRENRLVARAENALHYVADTQPGSSGSPVFNSEWRPIALHHWGSPWADVFDEDGAPIDTQVNEGIRISSIVRDITAQLPSLDPVNRAIVERALHDGAQPEQAGDQFLPDYCELNNADAAAGPTVSEDGRLNWTVPIEISVGIPALARGPQRGQGNRGGQAERYDPPVAAEPEAPEPDQERKTATKTIRKRTKANNTRRKRTSAKK